MRPSQYAKLTLLLPVIFAVLSGARTASGQEAEKPVKVVEGGVAGVRMEVLSLKRTEGGMLTLRVAFVNDSGGQVNNSALPGTGAVDNFALLDYTNRRKYSVVRDSSGSCLCTYLNPYKSSESGRRVLWAKFGAPPESVDHVTLLMPDAEPVDGVPILH